MGRWFKRLAVLLGGVAGLLVIAFAVGYLATGGDYVVAKTVRDDPSLPRAQINGTTLHLRTLGDSTRPTVVVLHGGPGDDFEGLLSLAALADEYHVVFYDQRGSGLSERLPAEQLGLDEHVADLDEIIRVYGNGRAHLIGHSWGAMLATAFASAHPERVGQLVLAEPGFLNPELGAEFLRRTNRMTPPMSLHNLGIVLRAALESLHVDGPDEQARLDYLAFRVATAHDVVGHPIAGYFCNGDLSTGVLRDRRFGALVGDVLRKSASDAEGNFTVDFAKGIERYTGRALFIASECNRIIGEDIQRRHMALFKDAQLAVIPGAGHTMFGEKPAESLAAIRAFLD